MKLKSNMLVESVCEMLSKQCSHTSTVLSSSLHNLLVMSAFLVVFVVQLCTFIANTKDFHPIASDSTSKVIYWSNFDIENPSGSSAANPPNVYKLILVIHGFGRNVADYYRAIETAAKQEGYNVANGDILLVAPKFKTSSDNPDANDIHYDNGWIYGDMSISTPSISSYAVIDSFLEHILIDQSSMFHDLSEVVLLGHSAGGQFVQRYALTNKLSLNINQKIHFVIANPSSFAYLDSRRWFDGQTYREPTSSEKAACPDYNKWKYGFADNSLATYSSYFASDSLEKSKANFIDRTVSYLFGAADTCPSKGTIDGTACSMAAADGCENDLQGTFRLERGINFWYFVCVSVLCWLILCF